MTVTVIRVSVMSGTETDRSRGTGLGLSAGQKLGWNDRKRHVGYVPIDGWWLQMAYSVDG